MCATIFAAGRIAIQRRVTSVCGAQTRETAASSRRDRAEAIDDPSTRSVSTHPGQAALQELTSVDYHYFFSRKLAFTSHQGLKFRRNFAEFRRKISFSLVTGKKNFGIFRKISFENSKFKKIRPKFTEIYRNFETKFRFR